MKESKVYPDVDTLIKKFIEPNMYLHFSATMSRPNALIYALARNFDQNSKSFTISMAAMHGAAHALTMSGIVKKLITGFIGDTFPYPKPQKLYKNVRKGEPFDIEICSLFSMVQRFQAAANNLPFAITNSIEGSHLERESYVTKIANPLDKTKNLTLLDPLKPDITLVHGLCADTHGNILMLPPLGEGLYSAFASKKGVIASVEKIIESKHIKNYSEFVVIPSYKVLGICEAKKGAHPQSLKTNKLFDIEDYNDDYQYLDYISNQMNQVATAQEWYKDWVLLKNGHSAYLSKLEKKESELYLCKEYSNAKSITDSERLIINASREIVRLVKDNQYENLLAGIGQAHIACWIAKHNLKLEGYSINLMNEMGFFDYEPVAGDNYLFSKIHADTCTQTSSTSEILGMYLSNENKTLAVLGCAQIDKNFNINSTFIKGQYVVGSGGANDIASTTNTLVVTKFGKTRMVKDCEYITSPGRNVIGVVTPNAVIKKNSTHTERYLSSTFANFNLTILSEETDSWNIDTKNYTIEQEITNSERKLLSEYDPKGVFR